MHVNSARSRTPFGTCRCKRAVSTACFFLPPHLSLPSLAHVEPVYEVCEATKGGNSAILGGLNALKEKDNTALIKSPTQTRLKRIQAASAQVDSMGTLAQLEQFDSARQQLRKGPLVSLRKDLEDARQTYPGITAQDTQDIKTELETLDQSLRAKDVEAAKGNIQASHDKLAAVINAILAATTPASEQ